MEPTGLTDPPRRCDDPGHLLERSNRPLERAVIETHRNEIEALIADAYYPIAFDKLQDYVGDFAPNFRHQFLILRSRFSRWNEARRKGLSTLENINDILDAALTMCDDVFRTAEISKEYRLAGSSDVQQEFFFSPEAYVSDLPNATIQTLNKLRKQYWEFYRIEKAGDWSIACSGTDIQKVYKASGFSLGPISFELRTGEITGVVGRNASGKTTLLRVILGEIRPDFGALQYPTLSREGRGWKVIKRQIASVNQLPVRWYGRLRTNLSFWAAAHGVFGRRNRDLVDWVIARYELTPYENATWDEISGGYKIRFELARALVCKPKLLVLDEPLAYLDLIARQRFLTDLTDIARSMSDPIPIIITSQHLYEIEAVADQMIFLDQGVCRYSGAVKDIGRNLPYRFFEISLDAQRDDLIKTLTPFGVVRVERTMEGYILTFDRNADANIVFSTLLKRYSNHFTAFRDISSSLRSLMAGEMEPAL